MTIPKFSDLKRSHLLLPFPPFGPLAAEQALVDLAWLGPLMSPGESVGPISRDCVTRVAAWRAVCWGCSSPPHGRSCRKTGFRRTVLLVEIRRAEAVASWGPDLEVVHVRSFTPNGQGNVQASPEMRDEERNILPWQEEREATYDHV